MRIGFDQAVQAFENLDLKASSPLQKGVVYEAKVVNINIKEGQVTLELPNGEQIQGQYISDILLRQGQKIEFQFLGLLDGQLNLKIQNAAEHELFQIKLQNALLENQIPVTEKNIEFAKILLENQIPVTKENIQKLLMGTLKCKEARIEELVFLLQAELDINPENVSQVKTLFKNEQSLQKGFHEIKTLIGQIEEPEILNKIDTSLQKLITVVDDFLELENVLTKDSIPSLQDSLKQPEPLIKEGIQKEGIQLEQAIISKNKLTNEVQTLVEKENIVLNQILKEIDISILKEIRPKQLDDFFKMQFLELETIKNVIKEHSFPAQEKILQFIEQTENKMVFLKDLNQNHQFIQIPFSFAQQDYTGNLYVLNKNRHKNLNPDDITAFVSLDTRNIGMIQVYIHKLEKVLSCNFETENYDSLGLIKKYMPKLQTTLNELGYQLQNVTYRVKEQQKTIVDLNTKPSNVQQLSFDKRV